MKTIICFELLLVTLLVLSSLTIGMSVQRRGGAPVMNDYYRRHYKRFVYDQPPKLVQKTEEENIIDELEDYQMKERAKQAALWKRKSLQKRVPIQCLINIIACW